jgi:hypothetical protein
MQYSNIIITLFSVAVFRSNLKKIVTSFVPPSVPIFTSTLKNIVLSLKTLFEPNVMITLDEET